MSTLISQGGFGCIYYPGITCSGKASRNKKLVSKLQHKDATSDNEVYVSSLVKKIKHYSIFFIPISSSCPIALRAIDPGLLTNCNAVDARADRTLVLLDLPYEENIGIQHILKRTTSVSAKKDKFLKILESYKYLLHALEKLLEINVVHFDLKKENILYSIKKNIPLVIDFGLSIPIGKLDKDNLKRWFYVFGPEYDPWPLEVHILSYILHHATGPLTSSDATAIAEVSVKHNEALILFSEDLRERYLESSIYQAKKYVGMPREEAIDALIKSHKTWDNYAISIMFIKLLYHFFYKGFHYNKFLILYSQLLLRNISPHPEVRLSPAESLTVYNSMYYIEGNVSNFTILIKDLV
jgi:serine/threonine protein kinase